MSCHFRLEKHSLNLPISLLNMMAMVSRFSFLIAPS